MAEVKQGVLAILLCWFLLGLSTAYFVPRYVQQQSELESIKMKNEFRIIEERWEKKFDASEYDNERLKSEDLIKE